VTAPFLEQAAIARDRYLSFYRRAIEELQGAPHLAVELLLQPNARTTPAPFCLMRVDALLGGASAPEIQRIVDVITQAPLVSFRLPSGLEIRQQAFSWEALRVTFSAPRFQIEALGTWLQTWLDPDEVREPDSSGLSGVMHDLAWSQFEPNTWRLDLDLGSAPLAALEELLDLLSGAGVTSLTLSRHDLDDA
jgi:hypothetical protein